MQSNTETYLIIFIAVAACAILLQAGILFGIFLSAKKTESQIKILVKDLKDTVLPVVHSSRMLIEKLSPEVVSISQSVSELTATVNKESKNVRDSISEITTRVGKQTERLDGMLTSSLNSIEKAGSVIESAVALPVRHANGVVAAFKAVVDTYRTTKPGARPSRRPTYPDPDEDMVI